MDDERNNSESAPENDFESQLAELIKQSGGTVPPKKKPEPAPEPRPESEAPREKTPEEIDAEIEAMINSMSDGGSASSDTGADFVMPGATAESGFTAQTDGDSAFASTEEPPVFEAVREEPASSSPETPSPDSSMDDIMAEIERLERETADAEREKEEAERARLEEEEAKRREAEHNQKIGEQLEDELEAMLEKMSAEPQAEPAAAEPEHKESEQAELFKEPVEVVQTQDSHEKTEPIDVNRFDKVEPPKEEQKPLDVATMEAMLQEFLSDDRAKKEEKEHAVVSEMEQMRAKIASLEYMLANAETKKADEKKSETPPPAPPQTDAQKIIEQAAKATKSDDINSMFKQWFDLEMAAKMKNIITEDEKKQAGDKDKQPSYDKTPAVYSEPEQGSDFIKLSDNVYYNVREKKTYVMRELKPAVAAPKKKVVKKKVVHRASPHRSLHARPGMRPRRPRRPLGPPRRRRP